MVSGAAGSAGWEANCERDGKTLPAIWTCAVEIGRAPAVNSNREGQTSPFDVPRRVPASPPRVRTVLDSGWHGDPADSDDCPMPYRPLTCGDEFFG